MKLVIIESPFKGNRGRNVRYALDLMRFCLDRGEAPFASHLLYPQCLDDGDLEQRDRGIEAGLAWGAVAEKTVVGVDLGISEGMYFGIQDADQKGRLVEYVSLTSWRGAIRQRVPL